MECKKKLNVLKYAMLSECDKGVAGISPIAKYARFRECVKV